MTCNIRTDADQFYNQMRQLVTDLQGCLLALLADLAFLTTIPNGTFTEAAYSLRILIQPRLKAVNRS